LNVNLGRKKALKKTCEKWWKIGGSSSNYLLHFKDDWAKDLLMILKGCKAILEEKMTAGKKSQN
jgi:hypothetical protein